MPQLDHLTVVAPSLAEGVSHVRACLDLDVPFGQRHAYMGTYNHLLQLGGMVYLEIVAADPEAGSPGRPRWFGLDDPAALRAAWDEGRRLRTWVARTSGLDQALKGREAIFGRQVVFTTASGSFGFSLRDDGALPLDGAAPCLIDRQGKPRSMAAIPDLGARLESFTLEHPDPDAVVALYRDLGMEDAPRVVQGPKPRYRARIATPTGLKELT